jgi:hypothetical protein
MILRQLLAAATATAIITMPTMSKSAATMRVGAASIYHWSGVNITPICLVPGTFNHQVAARQRAAPASATN